MRRAAADEKPNVQPEILVVFVVVRANGLHAGGRARSKYRRVRFLLSGLAHLAGTRGSISHFHQLRRTPSEDQAVSLPRSFSVGQSHPDF